jgi:exonuclease V gamma subunit
MTLFVSRRLECLIDFLAERLMIPHPHLSERWIILPSQVNKQWLMVELVKRVPGQAIALVQFLSWREALHRSCLGMAHIPDHVEMALWLSRVLLNEIPPDAKEALAPVTAWLKVGKSSRCQALIRSLSRQIIEAGYYGFEQAAPWQVKLCEMLESDFIWKWPVQILKVASLPSYVCQVHCFGTDEMPPIGWDFLLAQTIEPSIYLFSPCCMYWEDTVSNSERRFLTKRLQSKGISLASLEAFESYLRDTHPLLANWGRLGRETLQRLESKSLQVVESYDECEEDPARLSLLEIIQQDILFLRPAGEISYERNPDDPSIRIVAAGSSSLREIQILKDNILHFLQKTKGSPGDVLVLAPDIRLYESIIQFVFGLDCPVRIAPVAVLPQNSYLQAWQLFFSLADRSWEVDAVLELFENRAFQSKHQLNQEDMYWFRVWLKEAGVRGAVPFYQGSWPDGLLRMVSGLAYLLPEEEPLPRIQSIDWGLSERLALFIRLIELLDKQMLLIQKKNQTLEEWILLLMNAAGELFEAKENEDELWSAFLRKLSQSSAHFDQDLFPFALIRSIFEEDCQAATTAFQPFVLDAIQFSSLQPGALRPARAIFLLGLDSEHFPAREIPSTLNWEYKKIFDADRDQYLLLQSLCLAKELFCISYCHLSPHDGKTVEPALPVQELIQAIDTYYPLSLPHSMIQTHPAQPYDPRYFLQDSPFRSFSFDAFRAASAPPAAPALFWPAEPIKNSLPETVQFDLSDLASLARHPWKYFLQRRLGIYLKEEKLFSELRREDLILSPYQEQELLKETLHRSVDEVLIRRAHSLPRGAFGEWAIVQLEKKAADWRGHLQKWGISSQEIFSIRFSTQCLSRRQIAPNQIEAPPIVVTLSDGRLVEIVGDIDLLSPLGLLTTDEPNFFGILRHWPQWLAFLTQFPSSTSIYSLKKGICKTWAGIDAADALTRWIQYALRAHESLSPLISPWADAFFNQGYEDWKDVAQKSLLTAEDPLIRWILERSQPLPCERIWQEWNGFLKETFCELITEKEDA